MLLIDLIVRTKKKQEGITPSYKNFIFSTLLIAINIYSKESIYIYYT
jgi:hypothetical protein